VVEYGLEHVGETGQLGRYLDHGDRILTSGDAVRAALFGKRLSEVEREMFVQAAWDAAEAMLVAASGVYYETWLSIGGQS
jgi:hypothetical protein